VSDDEELRSLVVAYASGVDRRRFDDVSRLFTADGELTHRGRTTVGADDLAKAFRVLERYDVTTHFVGQQTTDIDGDRASGEVYCLAHHVTADDNYVMSIRYQDVYAHTSAGWRFASRQLIVDWEEHRSR
jgi:hypothetical protein